MGSGSGYDAHTAANRQEFLDEMQRELDHSLRWRRRLCRFITLGRHLWGKPWRVDVGPVGFVESDETLLGWSKQCCVCYEVADA